MKNDIPSNKVKREFVSDVFNEGDPTEGAKIMIIREGQAPKQLDAIKPNKVRLEGTIVAPAEFYNKRKALHDPNKVHVLFNKNKGTLTLVVDEQYSNDNYEVRGTILDNPDLEPFQLNKASSCGGKFTIKELMELLKFNRLFFEDKDVNAKIVTSLRNFKAKAEQTFVDIDDNRGNSEKSRITKLENELELSFNLNMNIHKGGEKFVFKVEILCEATSSGVLVYLESTELNELRMRSINNIIEEQLKSFEDVVCIEQ